MMVKNESKYLEDVLQSITPIREQIESEIIIMDTGSSDNTVEIAKKYTDKVYYQEWNNDFSSMRNKSISYASGEWIFILDGDEVLSKQESLINFFKSGKDKGFKSAFVNLKNITNEEEGAFNTGILMRLFRNSKNFKYIGAIHEQPVHEKPCAFLDITLIHYGYLATDSELMEIKFKRNSHILHKQLKKEPDNIYVLHQLSNTYGMYQDTDKALYYSKRAYETAKRKKLKLSGRMYVYTGLASNLWNNKKFFELEKLCKEAISVRDDLMDFYFYLGNLYSRIGEIDNAIENFEQYLKLVKDYENPNNIKDSTITYKTLVNKDDVIVYLSNLYLQQDDFDKVIRFVKEYEDQINSNDQLKRIMPAVIQSYFKLEDYNGLNNFSENKLIKASDEMNNLYYYYIEKHLFNMEIKDQEEFFKAFTPDDSHYNLLNKVRLEIRVDKGEAENLLFSRIEQMDFSILADYYGDIIYYLLIHKQPIYSILSQTNDSNLNKHFNYISKKYNDLSQVIFNYTHKHNFKEDIKNVRINKLLLRYALLLMDQKKANLQEYSDLFSRYIKEGLYYIEFYYGEKFINSEIIQDAKNAEDQFFIYLYRAFQNKDIDKLLYIKYLRKALEVYPQMSKGIEALIEDYTKPINEMNEVVQDLKQQVATMLSQNLFNEALAVVNEALKIIPYKADLYSIKAISLLGLEQYDEAIKALEKGIIIDPNHVDSLYNLAYIYEVKGQEKQALELYNKILGITKEEELIIELKDKVKHLENA